MRSHGTLFRNEKEGTVDICDNLKRYSGYHTLKEKKMLKIVGSGTSLVVRWLRLCSKAGDAILIPGQGTNIPPVTQPKN